MIYLGIDYGRSKIGLALGSDETPAVPYKTLRINNQESRLHQGFSGQAGIKEIVDIVKLESIAAIVVGVAKPMQAGNIKSAIANDADLFVSELKSRISLPIYRQDERLTSKQADALKKEHGQSGDQDAVAAMLILDSFLQKKYATNSGNVVKGD